ncbi:DNA primase [Polymorphospora sp. NPDC051019]|uniref:DNA primase n=1 Tax=Polymorphospora sp. NPDC051019 TaxID=3155725 RepID=UPI00341B083C
MARKSTHRPDADEPEVEAEAALDTDTDTDDVDLDKDDDGAAAPPADRSLWSDVRIDPIEIALPSGAGFTLRAYRMSSEVTPTDIGEREDEDLFASRTRPVVDDEDDETVVILDEEFAALSAETDEEEEQDRKSRRGKDKKKADAKKSDDDESADEPEGKDAEIDTDEAADAEEAEEAEDEEPDDEEVPAFLSHRGKLLLFRTPEALVSFVRSGAPNDLTQLDGWPQLVERLQPADVAPLDEDSYELDLVVENLRGGHDVWDATLLIEAGEVSRDLAYALRLPAVLDMLSPGSSLDDLDEALRSTVKGGLGGFMGRRRLKKIGAQTASLGWRTIIGKISAAVDWRD